MTMSLIQHAILLCTKTERSEQYDFVSSIQSLADIISPPCRNSDARAAKRKRHTCRFRSGVSCRAGGRAARVVISGRGGAARSRAAPGRWPSSSSRGWLRHGRHVRQQRDRGEGAWRQADRLAGRQAELGDVAGGRGQVAQSWNRAARSAAARRRCRRWPASKLTSKLKLPPNRPTAANVVPAGAAAQGGAGRDRAAGVVGVHVAAEIAHEVGQRGRGGGGVALPERSGSRGSRWRRPARPVLTSTW